MKRIFTPILAAVAALSLSSCFQQETTVRINKDGSGTIVQETTFNEQFLAMQAELASGAEDLASEERAKAYATRIGEGVTLDKVEAIDAGGKKGARLTFRFADINKVKLADPSREALGGGYPGAEEAAKANPQKPVTFKYADGSLTITNPQPPKAEAGKEQDVAGADEDPEAAMMMALMKDAKIGIKVVLPGGIAETNASHVADNAITLAEVDCGKLFADKESVKKMKGLSGGGDPAQAVAALKDAKGVTYEAKNEITVKLK